MRTRIARWQSRTGKHWVDLYRSDDAIDGSAVYTYTSTAALGCLGVMRTDEQAIAALAPRINDFQPDKNKTPMVRIA